MRVVQAVWCLALSGAILGLVAPAAADTIRLKDGQEVSGTILDDDGENVVIVVPRTDVTAVNGQPFQNPPAPPFTAVDTAGVTHSVPDPNHRVTLLKFWASWCPFCRSDIPLVKELFEQYRAKGLRILTVSEDQDPDKLQAFLRSESLPYPVILTAGPSVSAQQARIPSLYQHRGIPTYVLIDAKGTIVKTLSGAFSKRRAVLEEALKGLLQKASYDVEAAVTASTAATSP